MIVGEKSVGMLKKETVQKKQGTKLLDTMLII